MQQQIEIGVDIHFHQVGLVELAEDVDGLVLGGCIVADFLVGQVPGVLHRAGAVQQTDKLVGRLVEAMVIAGCMVL